MYTYLLLFKYPDLYKTAIALAAVPNQPYYDTIYQERYMNLPQMNVEGFRQGSAINFAHQLKGTCFWFTVLVMTMFITKRWKC